MKRLPLVCGLVVLLVTAATPALAARGGLHGRPVKQSTYLTTSLTLASGESFLRGSGYASDVGRVYYSTATNPYKLIRLNPADLTYTVYTAHYLKGSSEGLAIIGNRVFVAYRRGDDTTSTLIDEFNTTDATPVLVATHDLGDYQNARAIAADNAYLYIATGSGAAQPYVLKVRASDMAVVANYQAPTYTTELLTIGYDADYIFAGQQYPYNLYRLARADLSGATSVEMPTDFSEGFASGGYWWTVAGTSVDGAASVYRIKASDLTLAEFKLGPNVDGTWVTADPDGLTGWASWYSIPGQITHFNLRDGSRIADYTLDSGQNYAALLNFYNPTDFLLTCYIGPDKIIKLKLYRR